jgi:hypothetical protein
MANEAFRPACKAKGYCCPHLFLTHQLQRHPTTGPTRLARLMQICLATAKTWLKAYKAGTVLCEHAPTCFKAAIPPARPGSRPKDDGIPIFLEQGRQVKPSRDNVS